MDHSRGASEHEILQLHIGSAGAAIGHQCWQLYGQEHGLTTDGCILVDSEQSIPPACFFAERNSSPQKCYRPRALFVSSDSSTAETIRSGEYRNFYTDDQFHLLTYDWHSISDRIRKQIEDYDHFDGFLLTHSTNGRCSGFTANLLQHLASDYSTKSIVTNSVFDSSCDLSNMHQLLNNAHAVIPMQNEAILSLCKHRLDLQSPTYVNLNRLIAMCWSHLTCSMRFDGSLLETLSEFQRTLIPFPRLKMLTSILSPLIPFAHSTKPDFQSPAVYDMCIPLFSQSYSSFVSQLTPCKMVVAVDLLFRGENIIPKEIGQRLIMEMKRWFRFSDQTPTGFKCGINYSRPSVCRLDSDVAPTDKQVCALINDVCTSKYLCELSLSQPANSEHETTEFREARDYLQGLRADYEDLEKEILNDHALDVTAPFEQRFSPSS